MKNRIIAVIAGIVAGVVVVALGDAISHQFFPPPEGLDFTDQVALKAFIDGLPLAAFLSMLLIWMLSAFVGGLVTGRIVHANWQMACLLTGGFLLLGNVVNMFMIPQPLWLNLAALLVYLPLAWLGGKLSHRPAQT